MRTKEYRKGYNAGFKAGIKLSKTLVELWDNPDVERWNEIPLKKNTSI